jgi:hypothetical protein
MEQAWLLNFFRTALVIIVVYYLLRFVLRLVIPLFIKKVFGPSRQGNKNYTSNAKAGQKKKKGNKDNKNLGEYVDFEEID